VDRWKTGRFHRYFNCFCWIDWDLRGVERPKGNAMPDGFYLMLVLVLVLLMTGGIAAARSMRRRAEHRRASAVRPSMPDSGET
jgi:hypothetical protein